MFSQITYNHAQTDIIGLSSGAVMLLSATVPVLVEIQVMYFALLLVNCNVATVNEVS